MINYRIFALFSSLFVISSPAFAQSDCAETFTREAIYLRTEFFRGTTFVQNGASHRVGFAYRNLEPVFERSPESLPLFKKAQNNARISFGLGVLGLAGATAGTLLALQSVGEPTTPLSERRYRNGMRLILAGTFTAAVSLPVQAWSRRQLDDAIWLHNKALFH